MREHRPESRPQLLTTLAELRARVCDAKSKKQRVGLVPTMGALHAGHLSLIEKSKQECDFTVVTIFVNPTQFSPGEDFNRYPRDLQKDLALLAPLGVNVVFAPSREEMYPTGNSTFVSVERLGDLWEGAIRPGHFRGVATVVLKLFNAAEPDVAYFGQKDYQQSVIVRRMTADLHLPLEIRVCPIVRDSDGLALSSRNVYLSPDERKRSLSLSQSLRAAEELVATGTHDARQIEASMHNLLSAAGVQIDYAALVDPDTLASVDQVKPGTVALVAARAGVTRLIDNLILH